MSSFRSPLRLKRTTELTQAVTNVVKKVEDIKKLAADIADYFPSEYEVAMTSAKSIGGAVISSSSTLS